MNNEKYLYQAIREGAKLRPQAIIKPFDLLYVDGEMRICSCALGAAYEAIFEPDIDEGDFTSIADEDVALSLRRIYPVLDRKGFIHPVEMRVVEFSDLQDIITDLNDTDDWTREQIADWVETIEKGEPTAIDSPQDLVVKDADSAL